MPQFNSYPEVTDLLAADLILVYKSSVGAVKTINVENLAAAIKLISSRELVISNVNTSSSLDSGSQFVIGNSGADFTLTLPLASENPGLPIYISNKGIGALIVNTVGGDTIKGLPDVTIGQYGSYIFIADGDAMWMVFGLTP